MGPTHNLRLEKFTLSGFRDYYRLVKDIRVMAMVTERALTLDEAKQKYQDLIDNNMRSPIFGTFKILDSSSEEFLGLAKLEINDKSSTEAELGYLILPEHWGKGIASEVAKQLLQVAKEAKQINRVVAIIDPKNLASRKVLTNQGFHSIEFRDYDGLPGERLGLSFER